MATARSGRRIGVLGGSFDPVHIGHLAAASCAWGACGLERVVLIPARLSPFKNGAGASPAQRLAMLRLAVADDGRFAVSDEEVRRDGPSYTWETVRALAAREPGAEICLITGDDAFAGLAGWRDAARLAAAVTFLVAPREGGEPAAMPFPVRTEAVAMPRLAVSSTLVRGLVRAGRPIRYLVPDAVADYIGREGLYGAPVPAGC
jgi:nicotinate-nucleotide adenylyltransferase